jgi:hypothetical protein
MTVFVYVNTSKLFVTKNAAETWFEKNNPEGVAFEYEVLE